jgi:hypothetical protein
MTAIIASTVGVNTRESLVAELRELSEKMLDLAVKLEYFGGFDGETAQHGKELAGASGIVLGWADGIEQGEAEKTP